MMKTSRQVFRAFSRNRMALLFLAPAVILNATFFLYPMVKVVQMSFYRWSVIGVNQFLGLANYERLINDPLFWKSLSNTVIYTLIVTPGIFVVAYGLALLLNNNGLRGTTLFRSIYFMPVAISFVVASLVWLWIFNELYGILNYLLVSLGLISRRVSWLGSPRMARLSVSTMVVWKTAGFSMVILLAGLQGIPRHLYEASDIDGANSLQRLIYITMPMLRPTFVLAMLVSLMGSFLAFDHFYVMTQGGPANGTITTVMYIFRTGFEYFNLGYGSAISIVLLLLLILMSLFQMKFLQNDYQE